MFTVRATAGQVPELARAEISYLLTSIGASGCEFYRNGTWYDSHEAQAHLDGKYANLLAVDRIGSAEDFIEKAATRSSVSGLAYAVRCGTDAPVSSNRWLCDQLARYRSRSSESAPRKPRGAPTFELVS